MLISTQVPIGETVQNGEGGEREVGNWSSVVNGGENGEEEEEEKRGDEAGLYCGDHQRLQG